MVGERGRSLDEEHPHPSLQGASLGNAREQAAGDEQPYGARDV